jgi:hypothetical protein
VSSSTECSTSFTHKDEWSGPAKLRHSAHPVFVVWRTVHGKAKGRVVIDLRALNRVAVPDNYPLPLQSEIIASFRGKLYITAIDATSFFNQFGVYPKHRDRFTLISPRGLERPKVALMGFRNSPVYTQRYMDRLLWKHATYCKAFIDDIVIFSDNLEDHVRHLRTIFKLSQSKNIAISPTKSYIGYPNVDFSASALMVSVFLRPPIE